MLNSQTFPNLKAQHSSFSFRGNDCIPQCRVCGKIIKENNMDCCCPTCGECGPACKCIGVSETPKPQSKSTWEKPTKESKTEGIKHMNHIMKQQAMEREELLKAVADGTWGRTVTCINKDSIKVTAHKVSLWERFLRWLRS